MEYPTLTRRIMSSFLDLLFIFLLYTLLVQFFKSNDEASSFIRTFAFFALLFLYEPIMVSTIGTVGQNVLGITVRDGRDYKSHINIFKSFARFIIKAALGWLSLFAFFFSDENKTFHDHVINSIMIYKKDVGKKFDEEVTEEINEPTNTPD